MGKERPFAELFTQARRLNNINEIASFQKKILKVLQIEDEQIALEKTRRV